MSDAGDVAARILTERAHGRVERNGVIAPLTSYRLGGPADVLLDAAGIEDLEALAAAVKESGVSILVVGRGLSLTAVVRHQLIAASMRSFTVCRLTTRALSCRVSSTGTDSRRTAGGPSYGMPNSSAFSWNIPNSS